MSDKLTRAEFGPGDRARMELHDGDRLVTIMRPARYEKGHWRYDVQADGNTCLTWVGVAEYHLYPVETDR